MELVTIEEFLFLADSYRERKKQLESGRLSLVAKITECDNYKNLLWTIYWRYQDVISSKEIAAALSISVRELSVIIGPASAVVSCSQCGKDFTLSFSSRSAFEDFKRNTRGKKRVREYLCLECSNRKQQERENSDKEWANHHQQYQDRMRLLATMPYREYLQTPEWQQKRLYKLKRSGYRCELCNAGGRLNVHHRTYEKRGNEDLRDLIVLCETCHQKFHNKLSKSETA